MATRKAAKRKRPPATAKRRNDSRLWPWSYGLDAREVYILRRTSSRSLWALLTLQEEIKIGIAGDTDRRLQEVDKTTPGTIEIQTRRRMFFARYHENKLHNLFSRDRFTMKGGSGKTEWFYLTPSEKVLCYIWLTWYQVRFYFYAGLVALILISIAAAIVDQKSNYFFSRRLFNQ